MRRRRAIVSYLKLPIFSLDVNIERLHRHGEQRICKKRKKRKIKCSNHVNALNYSDLSVLVSIIVFLVSPKALQHTPQSASFQQVSQQSSPILQSLPEQNASPQSLQSTAQTSISYQPSPQPSLKESKSEILQQKSPLPLFSSLVQPENVPSSTSQAIRFPRTTQQASQSTPQSMKRQRVSSFSLQSSSVLRSVTQHNTGLQPSLQTKYPSILSWSPVQLSKSSESSPVEVSKTKNLSKQPQSVYPGSRSPDGVFVSPARVIASKSVCEGLTTFYSPFKPIFIVEGWDLIDLAYTRLFR